MKKTTDLHSPNPAPLPATEKSPCSGSHDELLNVPFSNATGLAPVGRWRQPLNETLQTKASRVVRLGEDSWGEPCQLCPCMTTAIDVSLPCRAHALGCSFACVAGRRCGDRSPAVVCTVNPPCPDPESYASSPSGTSGPF